LLLDGLVDPNDQHHDRSKIAFDLLESDTLLLPWPCLYETISTRLVRQRERLLAFESFLKNPAISMIDDAPYRDSALIDVFDSSRQFGHSFSLTDSVIRNILRNVNIRIDYLITFNDKDFQDVCAARGIEIFPGEE
jgi:hypothetical protein